MSDFLEFVIKRKARVVMARIRAKSVLVLDGIARLFGRRFIKDRAVSVYGVPMVPNFGDKTFRYCFYGTYGTHLSGYLDRSDRDFSFIDIGANQGLYTLIAARNPRCRKIIALEPVAGTFAILEANVRLNAIEDRVELVQAALSGSSGTAEISVKANHSGVASLSRTPKFAGGETETIRLITAELLDKLIPSGRELVVKVDVEGHEDVAIAELLKLRHRDLIAAIYYEMDERWTDAAAVKARLEAAGFVCFTKFGVRRHYDMLAERRA